MAETSIQTLRNQAPARQDEPRILQLLESAEVQKRLGAVATRHLNPERMMRLCVNAIRRTPKLMQCDPQSVLGAIMASTALGLEPNTPAQQAWLIPYDRNVQDGDGQWKQITECQFQIGYRGFITLAYRSPQVRALEAEAVHENDHFKHMQGSRRFIEYVKALRERGELIAAWCYTELDGAESATVLPLDEIHKIRGRSETYRALVRKVAQARNTRERERAQRKLDETPWVMWEDDMAAKSAIKKHGKRLPLEVDAQDPLATASEVDGDDRTIDYAAFTDPDVVRGVIQEGHAAPERGETVDAEGTEPPPGPEPEPEAERPERPKSRGGRRSSAQSDSHKGQTQAEAAGEEEPPPPGDGEVDDWVRQFEQHSD